MPRWLVTVHHGWFRIPKDFNPYFDFIGDGKAYFMLLELGTSYIKWDLSFPMFKKEQLPDGETYLTISKDSQGFAVTVHKGHKKFFGVETLDEKDFRMVFAVNEKEISLEERPRSVAFGKVFCEAEEEVGEVQNNGFFNVAGVKKEFYGKRDLWFSKWSRFLGTKDSYGDRIRITDLDFIQFRDGRGIVAFLEVKRLPFGLHRKWLIPPWQKDVFIELTSRTGKPFYIVGYRPPDGYAPPEYWEINPKFRPPVQYFRIWQLSPDGKIKEVGKDRIWDEKEFEEFVKSL